MPDKTKLRADFEYPPRTFRVSPMVHGWAKDYRAQMADGAARGYGGAVTNVPFENGFTSNPENLEKFRDILAAMEENGLEFWIYDEMGYPSGQGGGMVLDGHPELAAKGFYMHRPMRSSVSMMNRTRSSGRQNTLSTRPASTKVTFSSTG